LSYIIIIIAFGYLLKRLNVLQEKDGQVISKIIFKITLPSLVLVTFDSVKIEPSLILLPAIVLVYGIAYILGSYFSAEGLKFQPIEILKRLGKSIPLMTYLIASILNFSHIKLPDTIINVASTISGANIPLSLLLLGIYLNFKFDKQLIKPILKFLIFRYGLGLLFGVGLYLFLPYNQMFRLTILIGFLLPVAASALTFAVEFKYCTNSTRIIATISNITILISIVILYIFANFVL
jgi:malate permease and related proteins